MNALNVAIALLNAFAIAWIIRQLCHKRRAQWAGLALRGSLATVAGIYLLKAHQLVCGDVLTAIDSAQGAVTLIMFSSLIVANKRILGRY